MVDAITAKAFDAINKFNIEDNPEEGHFDYGNLLERVLPEDWAEHFSGKETIVSAEPS
jgi:hypothetical protein